jgi:O-methyltransferase
MAARPIGLELKPVDVTIHASHASLPNPQHRTTNWPLQPGRSGPSDGLFDMSLLQSAAKGLFRTLATHHPRSFCRLKMLIDHSIEVDQRFWTLYAETLREGTLVQSFEDFFNLYQLVLKTQKVPGEIAELGVYRGGSAKLIASLKGDKALHLFDTFEGMPAVNPDMDRHRTGDFAETSMKAVQQYLGRFSNIFYHPGFFPDSARDLAKTPMSFSMIHLDVDIYESTKAGLEFFYPRMAKGAIIISHDYRRLSCAGVKRAFDEFFADKPEPVIELWQTQCLVVKQ